MKPKVKLAATKILMLQAEFSTAELEQALRFLRDQQLDRLFGFGQPQAKGVSSMDVAIGGQKRKQPSPAESVVVAKLKNDDPQKYELLSSLDRNLQVGRLLTRLDSVRRFGQSLDKDFETGKSRKEAITKLMEVLVTMPLDEITRVTAKLSDIGEDAGMLDEGYQKLASFLLRKD